MNCWLKQQINGEYATLMEADRLCDEIGLWAPVIVDREQEKHYLEGLCLMMGKDHRNCILLEGVDKNTFDTPPTWVRIPHLN